jgi:N-acetyl-1-D-myo-inositol-2-amino-2-deoxy-alpha-D-glucopyranoside deacetylase
MSEQERVLFVHAHPDDESIATGGTIATLVDRGAGVTVLTCTRGERGEVIPGDLAHLLDSHDALAAHREGELDRAMGILGVGDHRYLGAAGARWAGKAPRRYVDSGMVWGALGAERVEHLDPDSLAAAEFGEVASDIAAVITDVRPDVVISYNAYGGYGHPDHIRAAQAAQRAAEVYGIPYFAIEPAGSEAEATMTVDVSAVLGRKTAALAAHRTQVVVSGGDFALSNNVSAPIDAVERFRRVHREYAPGRTPFAAQGTGVKVFSVILALVVGLCVGALLTVAHQATATVSGIALPVGIASGLAIIAALLVGLRLVFGTRSVPGAAALGILVSIGILSLQSSGGSVLVPQGTAGYVWTIAPTLIGVVVLSWPQLPLRRRDKMGSSSEVKGSLPQ